MYCYFSVSRSQMTAQSLSLLSILLLFLCELCTSETLSVFVVCYWRMLINFYIACTTIFQPVAAKWQLRVPPCYRFFFSSYVSYARLRLSVFVVCYCRILINFYIACTTIFQPVSARWQLSPRFFACFVSDAWLRLCLFFFVLIHACLLNFVLHVLLFFSQSQPPPNPNDTPNPNSSEDPKWVMVVCILF